MLNLQWTSGSYVTVAGLNFGELDFTHSALLQAFGCSTSSWTSASSVQCLTQGYLEYLQSYTFAVTLGSFAGTRFGRLSFDAPTLSYGLLNSAPSGGSSVTVMGLSFGGFDFTASSALAYGACSTSAWTSSTAVSCLSRDMQTAEGVSTVTVGGVAGTQWGGITFDVPVSSHLYPNQPLSGAGLLTIAGVNFRQVDASVSSMSAILVCSTTMWSSGTSVLCNAAVSSPTLALHLGLTVASIVGSTVLAITFDAAVLSYGLLNSAPSGGSSVTVMGLSFGGFDFTASSALAYGACSTSTWTSGSSVHCLSQSMSFLVSGSPSVLTVGAGVGTDCVLLTFDAPVGSHISLNVPHTGTGSLTVTGLSLLPQNATVSAAANSFSCVTTSWTSATTVNCLVTPISPAVGGPRNANLELTVAMLVGTWRGLLSFDAAVLSYGLLNSAPSGGS